MCPVPATARRAAPALRAATGAAVLVVAVAWLARVADAGAVNRTAAAVLADPLGLAVALGGYATAFAVRAVAWRAVLPGLGIGPAWAALHVSLLGNHVLPLRLGEALRVTSVLRRTALPARPVLASAVTLRVGDLLAVAVLAALAAPGAGAPFAGWTAGWIAPVALGGLGGLLAAALAWFARLRRAGTGLRLPGPGVAGATLLAWALEAAVVWAVAGAAGVGLSPYDAVAVTAVTVLAQAVAVTPGGLGTYEAAATAVLAAQGVTPATAFAVALATHAVKTAYAVVVGIVALVVPAPTYWGRFRLPRRLPPRPEPWPVSVDAPVVAVIPVYDEEPVVGEVVRRLPVTVGGRPLVVLVVDDGSTDRSAQVARAAGAVVVAQPGNLGLGAAVRRGLAEATALRPAAVVYLDADGEYLPEDAEAVVGPVIAGQADYVVGSRFAGEIRRMRPHRRFGNRVLTAWMRWLTRRRDLTDGQSGYRAFSPAAAAHAEVVHDYNYAQVLTLDLLGKGYAYREVPIRYAFRETGTSFVRLGRYLRRVVPAVHRELNAPAPPAPSPPPVRP